MPHKTLRSSQSVAATVFLLLALPCAVQAGPNILASVVPGCDGNVPIVTITLNQKTYGFYKDSLYYHFDPPSPGTQPTSSGNPVVLQLPSSFAAGSTHTVRITTTDDPEGGSASPDYSFTVEACGPPASNSKGLTWRLMATNSPTGTVRVGCGNNECDPRNGDTPCTAALPILCIKKTGAGFPLPLPASVNNSSQYNKWSGGIIGTTTPTVPPATLAAADALCAKEFGADWRVAEFHDGWGWYFQAYGGVSDPSKRFWVHINDQPGGTCWH